MNNTNINPVTEKILTIIIVSVLVFLIIGGTAINRPTIDTSNVNLSKYEFTNTDEKIIEYIKIRENEPFAYFKKEYTLTTDDIEEYLNKELDKVNPTDKKIEIKIKDKGQNIYLDGFRIPVDSIIKYSNPDKKKDIKFVIPSIYLDYRDKDLSSSISFREYYDRWHSLTADIIKEFSTQKLQTEIMENAASQKKPINNFSHIITNYTDGGQPIEYVIEFNAKKEKIYLGIIYEHRDVINISEEIIYLEVTEKNDDIITLFEFHIDLENNTYSIIQNFEDIDLEKVKLKSKEEIEQINEQKQHDNIQNKLKKILDIE